MDKVHYTTQYDKVLQAALPHLQHYPVLLPHIGKHYAESPKKLILIGESHYLSGAEIGELNPRFLTDWYNTGGLNEYYSYQITTRKVVEQAEDIPTYGYRKALSMYYRVKDILKQYWIYLNDKEVAFEHFAFYNFFQRPAFIEGASIKTTPEDNAIAYKTLKTILEVIGAEVVIFLSVKAYNAYSWIVDNRNEYDYFDEHLKVHIDFVPHPSMAWWNKRSMRYAIDKVPLTGREKFVELIKNLNT